MGRNADLVHMLGVPKNLACPECGEESPTFFDDYDIDCGCNPEPGVWLLNMGCLNCNHEWEFDFKLILEEISDEDN